MRLAAARSRLPMLDKWMTSSALQLMMLYSCGVVCVWNRCTFVCRSILKVNTLFPIPALGTHNGGCINLPCPFCSFASCLLGT